MTDEIPEIDSVTGTGVPVRGNDIDTDQIIPARFMKVVTFDGLGEFAFFDQRFDDEDNQKEHPFNEPQFQDASVLAVNANFGCGSSREHAPQALMRWGIDAIIGESFAEIFAGNCLALGIPTVTADHETIVELQEWIDEHPGQRVPRKVGEHRYRLSGVEETRALLSFPQWKLQRPLDVYQGLPEDQRGPVDALLDEVGGREAMNMTVPRRLRRENNRLVPDD